MAVVFESGKRTAGARVGRARVLSAVLAAVLLCAALSVLSVSGGIGVKAGVVRAAGQPRQMEIFFCDGSNQGNPRMFNIFPDIGFRFVVPDGYKLDNFVILAAPTWGNQANAGFTADIYEWRGDYDKTLEAGPVAERCVISHHQDNHSITMTFGYVPAGAYLVHIHNITDAIGSWESMCLPEEYTFTWAFYEDGIENKEYLPGTKITVSRDSDPHTPSRPTPTPVPDEHGDATEEPETTEKAAGLPTRERLTEAPAAYSNIKKGSGGLWAGIIIAVTAVAVTAAVIVLVVRKDKQQSEAD